MRGETDAWTVLVIVGLALVTVLTRTLFFISSKPWQLPQWAQRGLTYAPIAALAAVILPELLMTQGALVLNWRDARWFATLAGALWFFWRKGRGQVVLGTIIVGMLVYLPLHLVWGW